MQRQWYQSSHQMNCSMISQRIPCHPPLQVMHPSPDVLMLACRIEVYSCRSSVQSEGYCWGSDSWDWIPWTGNEKIFWYELWMKMNKRAPQIIFIPYVFTLCTRTQLGGHFLLPYDWSIPPKRKVIGAFSRKEVYQLYRNELVEIFGNNSNIYWLVLFLSLCSLLYFKILNVVAVCVI